ncbi:hypothetical protein GCM10010339_86070 [Streptomyces alanosinicus]|uniref:Uncharacterized protein n=1 Tax=Streptomyces alanosinicus TaxID=68171 RepID=A0A919D7Q6_9ACTN|nr:hypothetical protein GCM10010339_86070 [Streptomyces alanosinicus]
MASEEGWGFRDSDFADTPEGAAAVGAVTRGIFDTRVAQYRAYLDQKAAWGKAWSDASFSSEWLLDLTSAELALATSRIPLSPVSYGAVRGGHCQ